MQTEQAKKNQKFLEFVRNYLVVKSAKCFKHCERPASFVSLLQTDSSLIGAYVCPENFVSRVVYFAESPDPEAFQKFLSDQLGSSWIRQSDIRTATRHGWELGGRAEEEIKQVSKSGMIKQYYWTFYAANESEKKLGTFLCPRERGGCGRLFTKLISDKSKLCPNCSKRT
jgi:hypothetical protein